MIVRYFFKHLITKSTKQIFETFSISIFQLKDFQYLSHSELIVDYRQMSISKYYQSFKNKLNPIYKTF